MAIQGAFTKPYIYMGGYALHPELAEATLRYGHDVRDMTTFGQGTVINTPGLSNIGLTANGFVNMAAEAQEEQVHGNVGSSDVPVTLMPTNTPSIGDPAFFFKALTSEYIPGGSVGEVLGFGMECAGGDGGYPLCRGFVLEPGTSAKTVTGANSGYQAGAVSATQYLYGVLHVTSVSSGDDITVLIESDDNAGFTSATTRISFTLASDEEAQFATRVAGAITDDYWRVSYTINGADPSIIFACAMAIH